MLLKSVELAVRVAVRGETEVHEEIRGKLSIFKRSFEQLCETIARQELTFAALKVCVAQHNLLDAVARSLDGVHKWSLMRDGMRAQLNSFQQDLSCLCTERAFLLAVADCGVERSQISDCFELFALVPKGAPSTPTLLAELPAVQQWSPARMAAAWRAAEAWLLPVKPHETFLHYFIDRRSVLFEHFLSDKMHTFRGSEAPSSAYFGDSILSIVRNKLETLLSATEAHFVDMKEASDKLTKAKRSPLDELNTVFGYFQGSTRDASATGFDMQRTLTGLKSVLQLGQLSTPLLHYTRSLRQYGFTCVTDSAFNELEQIATRLDDPDCMAAQSIIECISWRRAVHTLLHRGLHPAEAARSDDEGHEECLGLCLLFQHLSDAADVWRFVLERGYFGQNGLASFSAKLELIANQGADEQLLNQLDPVVRVISTLICARTSPTVKVLMAALRNHRRIMKEACCTDVHRFQRIDIVQSHIARLTSWFDRGLGGIDAVFAQFKSISSLCSCYQFLLQSKQVQLRYTEVDTTIEMSGEALADFVQVRSCSRVAPVA
jgi:hypothetical protein